MSEKVINSFKENREEKLYLKMAKGVAIAFTTTLIGILVFAIILTYSNVPESTIPIVIIAISFISILLGSNICTRKVSKNGMINGGIIGAIYVIFLYIISSVINTGFSMNIYTILMIILGVIAGLIGRSIRYKCVT